MKHSTSINTRHTLLLKTRVVIVIIGSLIMTTTACKKQYIPEQEINRQSNPSIKAKNQLVLESIVINDSVVKLKCQNNLKQLGVGIHNYADGSLKKQVAYEYDNRGRLQKAVVKDRGYYLYEHNKQGRIVKSKFYPGSSSLVSFTVDYEYGDSDVDGRDFLVWQRTGSASDSPVSGGRYNFNLDGTIGSVEVYSRNGRSVLTGSVKFIVDATTTQIKVWKQVMEWFPEPEKPFEILSMLSNRVEMHGTGTVSDDVIVDGRIITAENYDYNRDGYLLKKETTMADSSGGGNGGTIDIESFSWGASGNY